MIFLLYLISLPCASSAADLSSDRWRVREAASNRLERSWPLSEAAAWFHAKDSPDACRQVEAAFRRHREAIRFEAMAVLAIVAGKETEDYDPVYWMSQPLSFFGRLDDSLIGLALMPRASGGTRPYLAARAKLDGNASFYTDGEAKQVTLTLCRELYRGKKVNPQMGIIDP